MSQEILVDLPNVTRLSNHVSRILGQNAGPYSLQGTNTYLVGSGKSSLLIDAGEGVEEYLPHLRSALANHPPVEAIVLTHWHHDHVHGLPDVLRLLREVQPEVLPRVWKHPSMGENHDTVLLGHLKDSPGSFLPASPDADLHQLGENHVFDLGEDCRLRVVSAPGHTDDSVCLLLSKSSSTRPHAIFTGDTVLGQKTPVFENLADYMASLSKLVGLAADTIPVALYPGHGPVIDDGKAKMEEYISHRMERENQVLQAMKQSNGNPQTPQSLVGIIYPPNLPESVVPAAARGLLQHLEKLEKDGKAVRHGQGWALKETSPSGIGRL